MPGLRPWSAIVESDTFKALDRDAQDYIAQEWLKAASVGLDSETVKALQKAQMDELGKIRPSALRKAADVLSTMHGTDVEGLEAEPQPAGRPTAPQAAEAKAEIPQVPDVPPEALAAREPEPEAILQPGLVTKPIPQTGLVTKPMPPEDSIEPPGPLAVIKQMPQEGEISPPGPGFVQQAMPPSGLVTLPMPSPEGKAPEPPKFAPGSPEAVDIMAKLMEQSGGMPITPQQLQDALRGAKWEEMSTGEKAQFLAENIPKGAAVGLLQMGGRLAQSDDAAALSEAIEETLPPPSAGAARDFAAGMQSGLQSVALFGTGRLLGIGAKILSAGVGGIYGVNQYRDVIERAKAEGKDPADLNVQAAAILSGIVAGGLGGLADYWAGKFLGLWGRPVTEAARAEVRSFSGQLVNLFKNLASKYAKTSLVEIPQEALTNGIEALIDQHIGLKSSGFWEAAKAAVVPTAWSSALFTVVGAGAERLRGRDTRAPKPIDPLDPQAIAELPKQVADAASGTPSAGLAEVGSKIQELMEERVSDGSAPVLNDQSPVVVVEDDLSTKKVQPGVMADVETPTEENPTGPLRLSKELLEQAFPGAKVGRAGMYGKDVRVTLPNGLDLKIVYPATIHIDPVKYKAIWGHEPPADLIPIGAWDRKGQLIALTKLAETTTLFHESYHVFQDFVLTPEEYIKRIEYFAEKPFKDLTKEEHRKAREEDAIGYANWVYGDLSKPEYSGYQKIADAARRFWRAFTQTETEGDFYRKIYERASKPIKPKATYRLYQPSLAKDYSLSYTTLDGAPPHVKTLGDRKALVSEIVNKLKQIPVEAFGIHQDLARVIDTASTQPQVRELLARAVSAGITGKNAIADDVSASISGVYRYLSADREATLPTGVKVDDLVRMDKVDGRIGHNALVLYNNIKAALNERTVSDNAVVVSKEVLESLKYPHAKTIHPNRNQYKFAASIIREATEHYNRDMKTPYLPSNVQMALWAVENLGAMDVKKLSHNLASLSARIPTELMPGGDMVSAIPEESRESLFNEIRDLVFPNGRNKILEMITGNSAVHESAGSWAGAFSPNILATYHVNTKGRMAGAATTHNHDINVLPVAAAAHGWVCWQDYALGYRILAPGEKPPRNIDEAGGNVVQVVKVQPKSGTLNAEQFRSLMRKVWEIDSNIDATLDNGFVISIPKPGQTASAIAQAFRNASAEVVPGAEVSHHRAVAYFVPTRESLNEKFAGKTITEYLKLHLSPEQYDQLHNLRMEILSRIQKYAQGGIEVSEADLDEIRRSASYETDNPPPAEKYAGSLNLPRFSDNMDIKEVAKAIYEANKDSIDAYRRTGTSMKMLVKMANQLGMTIQDVERLQSGKALNPEEMIALIQLNKWAANEVARAADEYRRNRTPENLSNYAVAYGTAATIMQAYQGAASEWGRVGAVLARAQTIGAKEPESVKREEMVKRMIRRLGGEEALGEKAKLISMAAADPDISTDDLIKMIKDMTPVSKTGLLYAIYVNSLLSGVKTQMTNTLGNALVMTMGIPTKTVGGMLDALTSAVTGRERTMYAREGWEYATGLVAALPDAFKVAFKTLRTGNTAWGGESKLEHMFNNPLRKVSKYVPLPTDFLQAADDFFKTLIFRAQANALIYRHAKKTGELLTHEDVISQRGIGGEIYDLSLKEAAYRTLQEYSKLATWLSNEPTGALKWVMPFKRTLINLVKMAGEYSPVEGILLARGKSVRSVTLTPAEKTEQLAKSVLGSTVIMVGCLLAEAGLITGAGPRDERERESLYLTGWRPYTIKTPWGIIDYFRLDPLSSIWGVAADVWDIINYSRKDDVSLDKVVMKAIDSIGHNIINKTMLLGVARVALALTQPDRYGSKWWEGFIGSFVPGLVSGIARAEDPTIRRPENVLESLKVKIPGMGSGVMPVWDRWGEVVAPSASTTWLQRLASPAPIYDQGHVYDIDKELHKKQIYIGRFKPELTYKGLKIKLLPEEAQLIADARQMARDHIEAVASVIADMDPEQAEKYVRGIIDKYDTMARKQLLSNERIMGLILDHFSGKVVGQ